MNTWSMINLQDANSPIMENLKFFHDYSMLILLIITIMISYIIISLMINNFNNKFILNNHNIEIIWTIMPMIILIFMAIPSLKILYLTDEIFNPILTIKSIGHQWYWSYEYSDFKNINFNSFMIKNFNKHNFRLLDVDNNMIIPFKSQIRLLINSSDVIHSWTVPSLGIKTDAIPGRINQLLINLNRPGMFFGQCSEICGLNHSFMPIVLESTSNYNFIQWINSI
uniref:Cytochrome c oxidase subunit 2 n=1 Tax=Diadegma semiclausum TaxID=208481 RepID=C4N020_DIASM|nr:cytochrome c oxidase subunit II [Diadegma semiclausum]ACF35058.1 cytochrome c oxidase subunit II [Diadegma semiclausum]